MSVFNAKSKTTDVEKLTLESQSIVDVFTKTATSLSVVNSKIETARVQKEQEASRLLAEKAELDQQLAKNQKWIDKINTFLD